MYVAHLIYVNRQEVLDQVDEWDLNKLPGLDGLYPGVLTEVKHLRTEVPMMCATIVTDSHCARWLADCCSCHSHPQKGLLGESCKLATDESGKMAEAIIKSKTYEPVGRRGVLGVCHHASYEGKSCLTNLTESLEEVNKQEDKGNTSDTFAFSKSLWQC